MSRKQIRIKDKVIGDGNPCFIIAEIGGNHNLQYDLALKLIDIAVDCGADAVKFQLSRAKTQYPPNAGYANYLGLKRSIYEIVEQRELPYDWIPKLIDYCTAQNIIFLCSACDERSGEILFQCGVSGFKIASYEATHIPLLKFIASKRKPTLLSVGVTESAEVDEAVEIFRTEGNEQLALLHCTASYPAPVEETNLAAIETLKAKYPYPCGISDHSSHPTLIPSCAAILGANIVEKHFTISKQLPGVDHSFALEPNELKSMIKCIRLAEAAKGDGRKIVQPSEKELYNFGRRTIFSTKDIPRMGVFDEGNTAILRSGRHRQGLHPREFEKIIGKLASQDIPAFRPIYRKDVLN